MADITTIPKEIRNWLASAELTYTIIGLNERMGFRGIKQAVIARLILRLSLGEVRPEQFIKELADGLNIDFLLAKAVAQEITDKLLEPIERRLRSDLGIDITKIITAAEMPAIEITPPKPVAPPAPIAPSLVPPPPHQTPMPTTQPVLPVIVAPVTPPPPTVKPPSGDQPYIIYKERPEMRETPAPPPALAPVPAPKRSEPPRSPEVKPGSESSIAPPKAERSEGNRTSTTWKVPVRTPTTAQIATRPVPPPPRQPIPPQQQRKPGEARMVHYSNLRTPLNQ